MNPVVIKCFCTQPTEVERVARLMYEMSFFNRSVDEESMTVIGMIETVAPDSRYLGNAMEVLELLMRANPELKIELSCPVYPKENY